MQSSASNTPRFQYSHRHDTTQLGFGVEVINGIEVENHEPWTLAPE